MYSGKIAVPPGGGGIVKMSDRCNISETVNLNYSRTDVEMLRLLQKILKIECLLNINLI
jgi:hypothetical protein